MTRPSISDTITAAKRAADRGKIWIRAERRDVTYAQLIDRIQRMAALLKTRGIAMSDRVFVSTKDDCEAALLFVSLLCNGVTAVLVDPDTGPDRARALIRKSAPALLILDEDLAAKWSVADIGYPLINIANDTGAKAGFLSTFLKTKPGSGLSAELAAVTPCDPAAEIPPETLAYILFTSGTTQQPKGVCISHRALFAHLATLSQVYGYTSESVILNTLMLSHADGMIQGPVISFFNAATLHRPMRFEVTTIDRLLDCVFQHRITNMVTVPTMLSLMVKLAGNQRDAFQGGDFRLLISCGAALEAALWQATEELFGVRIINVYGLTETVIGGVFAGKIAGETVDTNSLGSIGRPIDCELRIVGDTGETLGDNQEGELLMRGELLMSGYFDDAEQTNAVLRDGWLHTGDIAMRDENGNYFIRGRKKNIVIRGGLNIHPEEIAEALNRHPDVRDAIAFGMPEPDWGEKLVAVVAAENLSEAALLEFCGNALEPRKIPSRIAIVQELPKGRSGKIMIDEVRKLLDHPEATNAGASIDAESRLLDLAATCFKTDRSRLTLRSTPQDIVGWDSLAHMEFVVAVESAFGVRFSPRDIITLDRLEKALAPVLAA